MYVDPFILGLICGVFGAIALAIGIALIFGKNKKDK